MKLSELTGSSLMFSYADKRPTLVTDSTDFTVAAGAKGNLGATFTYTIPTKGILIIEPFQFAAKSNVGSSAYAAATFGISIGSTDYFCASGNDITVTGAENNYRIFMNQNASGWLYDFNMQYLSGDIQYRQPLEILLNIAANSIPTGLQTIQMRLWNRGNSSLANTLNVRGSTVRPLVIGLKSISWS